MHDKEKRVSNANISRVWFFQSNMTSCHAHVGLTALRYDLSRLCDVSVCAGASLNIEFLPAKESENPVADSAESPSKKPKHNTRL